MRRNTLSPDGDYLTMESTLTDHPGIDEPDTDSDYDPAGDEQEDHQNDVEDNPLGEFQSPEELLQAYRALEQLLHEKLEQVEHLTMGLHEFGDHARIKSRNDQEEDFIAKMRDFYSHDPVEATALMIRTFQEDALNDYHARMQRQLQQHHDFARFMGDFLDHPAYEALKPHRTELEFLIRDHSMPPETAAEVVRRLTDKHRSHSSRREAAARAVRNRAMVENTGEVGEPLNKESDFDRILRKSKTLDDMFERLGKIRL